MGPLLVRLDATHYEAHRHQYIVHLYAHYDEDITPSDVPADPPTVMQGPMARIQMRQLNLEVSSFLSDPFHTFKNRLLPNDVILLRNIGEGQ